MHRSIPVLFALAAIGCVPAGSFQGKVVHGMTGEPVAGIRILAKATADADLTCQVFEATTGEDGTFTVDGLCADVVYNLQTSDKTLLMDGGEEVPGGQPATSVVELKAWRIPGQGVFLLANDKLEIQKTVMDIQSKPILDSETERASYPNPRPGESDFATVGPDQYLVVSGKENVERYQFYPLIESGPRVFGTSKEKEPSEAWVYLGIEFQSDKEFTRKLATPDAAAVTSVHVRGHDIRYVKGSAIPAGDYALWAEGERRAYAFRFAAAGERTAAAAE